MAVRPRVAPPPRATTGVMPAKAPRPVPAGRPRPAPVPPVPPLLPLLLLHLCLSCAAGDIAVLESCRDAQTQLHEHIIGAALELYGPGNACFDPTRTVDPGAPPRWHRCRSRFPPLC